MYWRACTRLNSRPNWSWRRLPSKLPKPDWGKAEAALGRAQVMLIQRQSTNRRQKELATRKVISEQASEDAQRDEVVASADAAVAKSEVDFARMQLEGARAQLSWRKRCSPIMC